MSWTLTEHAGIRRQGDDYKIRATAKCPATGKIKVRKKTLRGSTIAEAIRVREGLKAEIRQTEAPTVGSRSLTHFVAHWVAAKFDSGQWNDRTAADRQQKIGDHILSVLGHIDVNELTRDDIRRWVDVTNQAKKTHYPDGRPRPEPMPYSHRSVRQWWGELKSIVKSLYLEGHRDRRFYDWVRAQAGPTGAKMRRREHKTLTLAQLDQYIEAAQKMVPTRYAEIVTLAYTGMRGGELYGLEWLHIDYDAEAITVAQSYSKGRLGPTKTGRPRTPPMLPVVAEALREHRKRLVQQENIGLFDGIVFPATTGNRRESSTLHKPMQRVADALGLDIRMGPQVFRSSLVTILRNAGANSKQIMSIVGHETKQMHEHYTRPTGEELRETVGILVS